jgi:hypothetical protein
VVSAGRGGPVKGSAGMFVENSGHCHKADVSVDTIHTPFGRTNGQGQLPFTTGSSFPRNFLANEEPHNRTPSRRRPKQPEPWTRHPHIFIEHRGGPATAAKHRQKDPSRGIAHTLKQKPTLTTGNAVPKVGLEPHSGS